MDLSVRDVARLLDITEDTVIRWARQGRLTAQRLDEDYRFNRVQLQECAQALGRAVPPEVFQTEREPLPRLSQALQRGGIYHGIRASTRDEALAAVVRLPSLPPDVNRDLLLQLLVARETLSPTGVGHGIAIPHARDPLVVRVPAPTALLAFLSAPVDFGAADREPVRVIFTLLSPTVRAHLQLLSVLACALHDADFCALLQAQASAGELLEQLEEMEARGR